MFSFFGGAETSWSPRDLKGDYFTFQMIQNILCFASGLVNALTIFEMGMTVSHQSGNTSHTGRLILPLADGFFG